jgi:2-polyprenyl-3-methyl-5-hydroxy-6-metoxy-1,4-benzoquinol methylase
LAEADGLDSLLVGRLEHWDAMYRKRSPQDLSWHEPVPAVSLRIVHAAIVDGARSVIDVGGGASRLVDNLVSLGLDRLAVLDLSSAAIDIARERLGTAAEAVEWIDADVTDVADLGQFAVWHDRAVFHFLTEPSERARYVDLCERTVTPGGIAVVATFAPDGPEMCSGLPVRRYDASELASECGPNFRLIDSERYVHRTPRGVHQSFLYTSFRRLIDDAELVNT